MTVPRRSHQIVFDKTARVLFSIGRECLLVPCSKAFPFLLFLSVLPRHGACQPATFAGSPQHVAEYSSPAQPLNRIRWSTSIDLNNTAGSTHYGAPLLTPSNTVIVAVKGTNTFRVSAFEGATGHPKYTVYSDYLMPSHGWIPAFQPVLATNTLGTRLYWAGAGGTVYYIDGPDTDTPGVPVHVCFYTNLAGYTNSAASLNSHVFVNTPITADTNGVIYFGFRVDGAAPAPLNTTNSGFVRIAPDGSTNFVLAGPASGDVQIYRDSHNCAPALSNDGATLYAAVKGSNANYAYLLGLDSATLATKYKVFLRDPRNGLPAGVLDDGTASPMIAPEGDVYFGIYANPNNGSRGYLLRFSADLQTQKLAGGFGWDNTPAIVPTNMVPGYSGSSPYLIFTKYNNYGPNGDGDGINRIALLDPNAAQTDAHASTSTLSEMREVFTAIGPSADPALQSASYPYAVREWCINTAAVNPALSSVFAPSEDGHIYRWDLRSDSLAEALSLTAGIGEPYVPTVVGPDGTVFSLNGGTLFALGGFSNFCFSVYSSSPDTRTVVAGDSLTFTAVVTNKNVSDPAPTGTVTFADVTYQGLVLSSNVLAANVPVSNGVASITISTLIAASNYLGSHFITAFYSGDDVYPAANSTLVQKVHSSATMTTLASAQGTGSNVIFTAMVAAVPAGAATPSGQVTFFDGQTFLAQRPLKSNGTVSYTNSNYASGGHAVSATYASDTVFAASTGTVAASAPGVTVALLIDGTIQLSFTNSIGAGFTVLGSADMTLPLDQWTALGAAIEVTPGSFQFTDSQVLTNSIRFYRIRSP